MFQEDLPPYLLVDEVLPTALTATGGGRCGGLAGADFGAEGFFLKPNNDFDGLGGLLPLPLDRAP